MKLKEILNTLYTISKADPSISMAKICGGIPRDKIIGDLESKFEDLDITNGDASIRVLADEFSRLMGSDFLITKKVATDGHVSVYLKNLKIDFSSNFNTPNIEALLLKRGIQNPTALQKEMYSRDFTCNALLLSLDLKNIEDPIGVGVKDTQDKILRTCLDPDNTFRYNTNRIPRVFYLATKLGFQVDPAIIEWIKNNPDVIRETKASYTTERLEKAMKSDPEKTVRLLNETNLWNHIPISESLMPYYQKKAIVAQQFFSNYDLTNNSTGPGTSVYNNIQDEKSVSEWRKKRIKRRKKLLNRILTKKKT
jgi:hypothetical protein